MSASAHRCGRAARAAGGSHIPYAALVAENVVKTTAGDYLQVFRLGGASFESADDEELNNWHERLNVTWRNIASPNLALWTHVVRRAAAGRAGGVFGGRLCGAARRALSATSGGRDADGQ